MPGLDRTGPQRLGSMTGRGFGPCGFGWHHMFGRRRGLGRLFGPRWEQSKEEKVSALEEYKKALAEELEDVEAALKNPDRS